MEKLETNDIQAIILKGYSNLPAADFFVLSVKPNEAALAKKWLKSKIPKVSPGNTKPQDTALNIAFTFDGMKALGLDKQILNAFPMELEDGMTTRHKQQLLGDFGSSDPANWQWGGKNSEPVHVLLMMYAVSESTLNTFADTITDELPANGFSLIKKIDTTVLAERKEHFGFHDGIAQPTIKGLDRQDSPENTIAAGEFILGYKNEYDQYPDSPLVDASATNVLPQSPINSSMRDFGKNGSYLVFRQIIQDVPGFWKYMDEATRNDEGNTNEPEMIKLASKMVGRWPSGAPLVLSPDKDTPAMGDRDNFGYRDSDPEGMKCPFSAHARRSNPRDSIDVKMETAIQIAKRHRILRRGRPYGTPLTESLHPAELLKAGEVKGERGLCFICFNADIGRQFEFIQNVWVNNPKFEDRYDERDPVAGNHHNPLDPKTTGTFSVPQEGLRKRYTNIPEFISTKGGAYFFMPGIKALHFLTSI